MTAVAEPGEFMIMFTDQHENSARLAYSGHTNVMSGGQKAAVTGETYKALPFTTAGVVQSLRAVGRVVVWFKSDAADTIESEECQWEIPMLVLDEQNRVIGRKVLTQENMTGFTQAGTVDVVCSAGVPARLAYYDVPRGTKLIFDPNGKVRAYMADDTS